MNDFISILKTEDIIRVSPQENLSSALSKLTTSHDAAFVFNNDEKFIGVVNPYYGLIRSSYPGNAKVEHCVFHPPHIKSNYTLSKIAKLFMESKIHYLPVFGDKDDFQGIVSARRILGQFKDSVLFKKKIKDILDTKKKGLVAIDMDDPINNAIKLFKETKLSKLIVTGKDMKLKGILSYYDLISYMVSPKKTEKKGDRIGNKVNFYHLKVKNFSKTFVLTLSPQHTVAEALNLILEKQIGSIVIVDAQRHPIGILTTRDFLRLLVQEDKEKKIQFIGRNLSNQSRQIVGGFFKHLQQRVERIPDVNSARLLVKEQNQGKVFNVMLSLFPKRGSPVILQEEGKDLKTALKKIKRET